MLLELHNVQEAVVLAPPEPRGGAPGAAPRPFAAADAAAGPRSQQPFGTQPPQAPGAGAGAGAGPGAYLPASRTPLHAPGVLTRHLMPRSAFDDNKVRERRWNGMP